MRKIIDNHIDKMLILMVLLFLYGIINSYMNRDITDRINDGDAIILVNTCTHRYGKNALSGTYCDVNDGGEIKHVMISHNHYVFQ
jgi:hypothetical protein